LRKYDKWEFREGWIFWSPFSFRDKLVRRLSHPLRMALFFPRVFFLGGQPMNTAFALATLTSLLLGVSPSTPTWNGSYSQAQEEAAGKKPLAVVFGSGQEGWTKLVRSEESKKLLAEQYVCVYVDTTSEAGKKLASSFAINNATGVVLSDRSGGLQAYWHNGDLADTNLVRSLRKYGNPQVIVSTTEREAVNGTIINGVYTSTATRSSCPNGNCPYAR
jgi:hypothetical protein